MRILVFLAVLTVVGCRSAQQRREDLLRDRVQKLAPLTKYNPTWCQADASLTQPALARYRQLFPEEAKKLDGRPLTYTWKARESACEVTPLDKSPATLAYKAFLDSALCVLMQTHWVNSPFDEFPYAPERLTDTDDGKIHLSTQDGKEFGLFLDPAVFSVQTRTKGRGTFDAVYTLKDGQWLPERLAQRLAGGTQIVVDEIEWEAARAGRRRMVRSLQISAGEERPLQHSKIEFSGCREY